MTFKDLASALVLLGVLGATPLPSTPARAEDPKIPIQKRR